MRYEIVHHGTPIGHAEFVPRGLVVTELEPTPGYDAVRAPIRAASEALWHMGFFGVRGANPSKIPEEHLALAASRQFDIRDDRGHQLHPDWVNIIERPGPAPVPALVARFSLEHGRVPSVPEPLTRYGTYSRPDG